MVTLETPDRVGIPTTLGIGYDTDEGGGTYGDLIGSTGDIEGDMLDNTTFPNSTALKSPADLSVGMVPPEF